MAQKLQRFLAGCDIAVNSEMHVMKQYPDDTDRECEHFSFRPAPLRSPVKLAVKRGKVAIEGAWEIDLANVVTAAFIQTTINDSHMVRLDLYGPGVSRSIGMNAAKQSFAHSEDARQFYGALVAVLRALAQVNPRLLVVLGTGSKTTQIMFGLGLASAILGVGLFTTAVVTGVPASKLSAAAVPLFFLVLIGGGLMRSYWPWRARVRVAPDDLVQVLLGELQNASKHDHES